MRKQTLAMLLGLAGLTMAASGCVVRGYAATPTVHGGAYVGVESSQTYTVQAYPPEPLYEEVSVSPGYGHVWIDGYWHWNGYRWVWIGGRWMPERVGYVYVSPYYDFYDGRYVYRPGYWSSRDRLPRHVRVYDHRDGRPATYVPDRRDHRYDYRPGVRDHRGGTYVPPGGGVRDHRTPGGGYNPPPRDPRDHRSPNRPGYQPPRPGAPQGPAVDDRDHRAPSRPGYQPPRPGAPQGPAKDDRDHRAPSRPGYERPRPPTAGQGPAKDDRGRDRGRDHRKKDD